VVTGLHDTCAKVQLAYGLCKGANVGHIFGSRVSAPSTLVRVIRFRCGKIPILNLYPNLKT